MRTLRAQRGVALITAMLVVAIGTIIAVNLMWQGTLDLRRAEAALAADQGLMYVQGAEAWAADILRQDLVDSPNSDHLGEQWATELPPLPVDGGAIVGRLEDLQGRFNLNNLIAPDGMENQLVRREFERLLSSLDIDPALAGAVVDWLDPDTDLRFPTGGEDVTYSGNDPPYRTANSMITSVSELMAITGFDRESYLRLAPYVTVLPSGTKLNVNTASDVLLASLSDDIDIATAGSLVDQRGGAEFVDIDATFEGLVEPDVLQAIDGVSEHFLLTATVTLGTNHLTMRSVLQRDQSGITRALYRSLESSSLADTFFVRLSESGSATWGAFDATGGLVGTLGRGSLAGAHAALANRRCTVLVNGIDVLAAQAELPAASQARLRQIVPFSLEESLADDLERMVFAIGARLASGATQVAAVAKERMDAWLAQLRAAGIVPQTVCSEADGVPDIPATLVLLIEGSRIAGREPGQPPFVFDGLTLRQVLDLVRGRTPAEAELRHIRVFADEAARKQFAAELRLLSEEFASADVKLLSEGVFPHLAATLAQRAGTNLLQGPYAPRSNWLAMLRPWRLAACLVAASAVFALVLEGAEFWQLQRADAELTDAVASACQRVVGDPSTSGCQREVRQRLGASAGGTNEDFLSTLAAIAAVRDAETRVDALSYRNRQMDLQLVVPSVTVLDEFSRELEQTQRFDVELEATNQSDAGTEGRIRIVGVAR